MMTTPFTAYPNLNARKGTHSVTLDDTGWAFLTRVWNLETGDKRVVTEHDYETPASRRRAYDDAKSIYERLANETEDALRALAR